MDTKETIANALKGHIRKKGITQREAAYKIGISPSHLANLLNAREAIGYASARKICDAFPEINVSYIMTGDGDLLGSGNININQVDHSPHSTITQGADHDKEVTQLREQLAQAQAEKERLLGIIDNLTKK